MKPYRISSDGIGCVIRWYENGCRVVMVPAEYSTSGRREYRCEVAMYGAGPEGWDYHHSAVQRGPTYNTFQRAYADVAKAPEIRRAWHAARAIVRKEIPTNA